MTTVLVSGCFDPFHAGHLLHLEAARQFGDRLVVAVTKDAFVHKGENRPVFAEDKRLLVVKALRCVDEAMLSESSREALEVVKPQVFVLGMEYRTKICEEDAKFCAENGITIGFTNEEVFSSSALLTHGTYPTWART